MPSKSKKQQIAMAIAEHEPKNLYKRNKSMLNMTDEELHDFSTTKRKKLPKTSKKVVKNKQQVKKMSRKRIASLTIIKKKKLRK